MTIRKKLLIAALIFISGSCYTALLMKLSTLPHARVSQCQLYGYTCYAPPLNFWP